MCNVADVAHDTRILPPFGPGGGCSYPFNMVGCVDAAGGDSHI